MKGYPKQLNSWEDVLYVVEHFPKEQWYEDVHCLICDECLYAWCADRKLDEGEEGITDETHKVVENQTTEGTTERWQYVKQLNENAKLFRMRNCQTQEDREKAISDVEEILQSNANA